MAEIVAIRKERMLPEYEQMRQWNLFSDEEIRNINKSRDTCEYKIKRQTKAIKDYCKYIAYERHLLEMVIDRKKSKGLLVKNCPLEVSIANRIKFLYKQVLSRFPEHTQLYDNCVKFSKFINSKSDVSATFEKMLQFHGDKAQVWLRAIKWEYYEVHNMDKVKDYFMRGLQRHPDNRELYIDFFKIMLQEASNIDCSDEADTNSKREQALGLERVVCIYETSKKKIHSNDFLLKLLEIAQEYPFAKSLEKRLIDDMMNIFPLDELTWNTLAQRELNGMHMFDLRKLSNNNEYEPEKRTLRRRIELCVEIYENSVKELKTERMWSMYLNAMLSLNENASTQQVLKRKVLSMAFKGAHEANCMSETNYLQYIELLIESNADTEYILSVIQTAITKYYSSAKLWELCMRFHILQDEVEKVEETFHKALKKLASAAYPLWKLLLQFYQTRPDLTPKVEETFKELIKVEKSSFSIFKIQYVEWMAITKSMVHARKLYNELALLPPFCLELHQKMSSLESIQLTPNIPAWRKCHDFATQFFGKERTDVWIDYIKFERDHGEAKSINNLYERAKAVLHSNLVDNFISEYCFLTTGVL